jgi:hypothetical protein
LAPVEELTAVGYACDRELALGDQPSEQGPQRGRAQLVPDDPQVLFVSHVELGDANPTGRRLDRERLLLGGEVVDIRVENAHELFPIVAAMWSKADTSRDARGAIGHNSNSDARPRVIRIRQRSRDDCAEDLGFASWPKSAEGWVDRRGQPGSVGESACCVPARLRAVSIGRTSAEGGPQEPPPTGLAV